MNFNKIPIETLQFFGYKHSCIVESNSETENENNFALLTQ